MNTPLSRPLISVAAYCPYDGLPLAFPDKPIQGASTKDLHAEYPLSCECGWKGTSPKYVPLPEVSKEWNGS